MHANFIMPARLSVRLLAMFSMVFIASCEKEEGDVTPSGGNGATASIATLNCEGVLNTGTLTAGVAASGVSSSVSYTGGNGTSFGAQSVGSTGVTGLTATLAAGTLASGAGTLNFTITGTPSGSGTASFALSLGGQVCALNRNVVVIGSSAANSTHSCGAPGIHNPNRIYGNMTDQEGNVYKTIVIGGKEWMAENLNTSVYRNGEIISTVDSTIWGATYGLCSYWNNDSSVACPYGKLYNWYACVDTRQLCPTGWHIPTNSEWTALKISLGGEAIAGGKMKSTGTIEAGTGLWHSPNSGATNISGFSGIPSPHGNYVTWWSSTEVDSHTAHSCHLGYDFSGAYDYGIDKRGRSSVRCLRD
jgi:uncharacterized protein (TIGR02145 family)